MTEKKTVKRTVKQARPVRSGFDAPMIGVVANTPAKYLPNGSINPEWKKQQNKKK